MAGKHEACDGLGVEGPVGTGQASCTLGRG